MPSSPELIEKYLQGPKILQDAVAGMSREQLLARPVPGKWSTLEVVCHLADFEPVYVDRMKRVIALDHPLILAADENRYAERLYYHERDLEEELKTIELLRAGMGRILRQLPATVFEKTCVHSERGLITLEQLIGYAANHITHHVPFIHEKRKALGS